jgi:hypothetical protein
MSRAQGRYRNSDPCIRFATACTRVQTWATGLLRTICGQLDDALNRAVHPPTQLHAQMPLPADLR